MLIPLQITHFFSTNSFIDCSFRSTDLSYFFSSVSTLFLTAFVVPLLFPCMRLKCVFYLVIIMPALLHVAAF